MMLYRCVNHGLDGRDSHVMTILNYISFSCSFQTYVLFVIPLIHSRPPPSLTHQNPPLCIGNMYVAKHFRYCLEMFCNYNIKIGAGMALPHRETTYWILRWGWGRG